MVLGALIDAGGKLAVVEGAIEALGLAGEVAVSARHEQRGHLGGTRVLVELGPGPSRTLPDLERAIAQADVPDPVRGRSLAALRRLGAAEAEIHGADPARLHLHELGGADTLVDLVGAFWLLDSLGVERVHASPLPAPRGRLPDGLPLPAPASLRVLAGTGAVLEPEEGGLELVTPTGAAILAESATFSRPAMSLRRLGYGIGAREKAGNALAVWLGDPVPEAASVTVIETNLDDMQPDLVANLAEELLGAGALDVTITPVLMKKGRPGHALTVLVEPSTAAAMARRLLRTSTTLGLRMTQAERVLAARQIVAVATPFGEVRVKVKTLEGAPADVRAEYEDCRRLARLASVDIRAVSRAAEDAARRQTGLST